MITQKRLLEIVHYNPVDGSMTRLKGCKGAKVGAPVGTLTKEGYLQCSLDGVQYKVHRLVWLYVFGELPAGVIDHVNGVRSDNRICNLRDVNSRTNSENRKHANVDNKIGLLGVCSDSKNVFRARIRTNGVLITLGWFSNPENAHEAYVAAKRRLHKGCTI